MSQPMTFAQWLTEVDKLLIMRIGLDHDSLEDWYWYDYYSSDNPPHEAVDWCMIDMGLTIAH